MLALLTLFTLRLGEDFPLSLLATECGEAVCDLRQLKLLLLALSSDAGLLDELACALKLGQPLYLVSELSALLLEQLGQERVAFRMQFDIDLPRAQR